jgi:hypothetical protein
MESDPRYYWRRACEEMAAASRSLTPAACVRHEQLVRLFVERLKELDAPCPFSEEELAQRFRVVSGQYSGVPIFRWEPQCSEERTSSVERATSLTGKRHGGP